MKPYSFTDFTNRFKKYLKPRVHRDVKDRLFRFLFNEDREALLQLYNALNGTNYTDTAKLEVVTIKSAVYVTMKNDLAFMIAGVLNLYEHQSTFNPNLPVRFLTYLAEEYQIFIEQSKTSIYGTKQIMLPTPHCVVFYNGEKEEPEEYIQRLSDAFMNKDAPADVEVTVRMLNINYGYNAGLMEQFSKLEEYARFVQAIRQFLSEGIPYKRALNEAVNYCIENHILEEFLRKNRQEVLGMLLEDFDAKKYERTIREEGIEEEREHGIRILIETCIKFGVSKEEIIKQLIKEYSLTQEQAETYYTDIQH
jgi:hypothetical protein